MAKRNAKRSDQRQAERALIRGADDVPPVRGRKRRRSRRGVRTAPRS